MEVTTFVYKYICMKIMKIMFVKETVQKLISMYVCMSSCLTKQFFYHFFSIKALFDPFFDILKNKAR